MSWRLIHVRPVWHLYQADSTLVAACGFARTYDDKVLENVPGEPHDGEMCAECMRILRETPDP